MTFFQDMEPLLRMFWYIALPVSSIFIIQSLATFIGADATDGLEADFDGNLDGVDSPAQIFSFRNLINFLLGFSWSGIALYGVISNHAILIAAAVIFGVGFVTLFFIIIKQLQKLAEDNSFKLAETVGKTAEVYLRIPEKGTGKGKIQVSVKGATHEIEAVSITGNIETGSLVKVIAVVDDGLVSVEKF